MEECRPARQPSKKQRRNCHLNKMGTTITSQQKQATGGLFYVFANKRGTVQDEKGMPIVRGNYFPCWVESTNTYSVQARWCDALWHQTKLSHEVYEEYVFACRQGVLPRKRNLDAVRSHEEEKTERAEMEEVVVTCVPYGMRVIVDAENTDGPFHEKCFVEKRLL